ncbi:antitoxin VbhA family protein [Luteipulveratus halotolerans]|uniref:antitoxin VbhA family protein n=1 Tax=Luteipulveratus halotolerans TaxID=1631356 RepID=UPI0012FCF545|nr:antitoxin VbhA family protein [Luteipulveratus halotolerans]
MGERHAREDHRAAERARRRREVDSVRHSTEMDGGSRTQEAHDDQEAYVRGELTLVDLAERADRDYGRCGGTVNVWLNAET